MHCVTIIMDNIIDWAKEEFVWFLKQTFKSGGPCSFLDAFVRKEILQAVICYHFIDQRMLASFQSHDWFLCNDQQY